MAEKSKVDPLILDALYTDPMAAFLFRPKSLEQIKDTCLLFLDTSMLLLPYDIGTTSLADIRGIYKSLSDAKRLLIPSRAIQEFENRVPGKIVAIYQKLTSEVRNLQINFPASVGLLQEIVEYKDSIKQKEELSNLLNKYKNNLEASLQVIETWHHDDPVRRMYREIFGENNLATFVNTQDIKDKWAERLVNQIPPGYHDNEKKDSGIGDYLVWKAVLATGAERNLDALLVTADKSSDVWHGELYARREMVEEYRKETGGRTIRFVKPKEFLEIFGALPETIADVASHGIPLELDHPIENSQVWVDARGLEDMASWLNSTYSIQIKGFVNRGGYLEAQHEKDKLRIYSQILKDPSNQFRAMLRDFQFRHSKSSIGNEQKTVVLFLCDEFLSPGLLNFAGTLPATSGMDIWICGLRNARVVRSDKVLHSPY